MAPLAIDLFCGLGGWTEGLLAEGYRVVGFDIKRHEYGDQRYPAQLVIQDVRTLHGSQFRHAALIVASPPCQKYSYMAMPWRRSKALAAWYREDPERQVELNELFNACFRIQREACEAAGRHIPLVVENVRGAIPWVGRSRWNYGSFHLWGDVPALMPIAYNARKVPGFRFDGSGTFQSAAVKIGGGANVPGIGWTGFANTGASWRNREALGRKNDGSGWRENGTLISSNRMGPSRLPSKAEKDDDLGIKCGGDWFGPGHKSAMREHSSKSPARKAATALIAKIPLPLSRHIAAVYKAKTAQPFAEGRAA